ncbi:MAG: DUF4388 domain-containing protein [Caldisericia bacterium]
MGIQGRIGKTTPLEVISFLNSAGATGILSLSGNRAIEVFFRDGSIVTFCVNQNDESVYEQIANFVTGSYFFADQNPPSDTEGIKPNISTKSIIHIIAKSIDDVLINPELYDSRFEFELSKDFILDGITLDVNEWRVVAMLSEKTDIGRISRTLGLSYLTSRKIVFALEQIGVVKRVRIEAVIANSIDLSSAIRKFLSNLTFNTIHEPQPRKLGFK